jgi:indolepyruvate decarboxylase
METTQDMRTLTQRMTIGDFLLRRLEEARIRHLFGVPGGRKMSLECVINFRPDLVPWRD